MARSIANVFIISTAYSSLYWLADAAFQPAFQSKFHFSSRWTASTKSTRNSAVIRRLGRNKGSEGAIRSSATIKWYDRRDLFKSTVGGAATAAAAAGLSAKAGGTNAAEVSENNSTDNLLADLPMIRLRLPKQGLGREYVAIQLKIQGQGPFDFMVDSGLTTELITPHLTQSLGISSESDGRISGIGAGGSTTGNKIVELRGASLCCGTIPSGNELQLPVLHAIITDFPQEHIDPQHDPVEGMIGLELLSQFDVDFDFPEGRLRLWKPGTAAKTAAFPAGLVEIPAVTINETGLIGIRLTAPGSKQPILGFLDCGSAFTAVNWKATSFLGLPQSKQDAAYKTGPKVVAVGVDGRPLELPTLSTKLSFAGDIQRDVITGQPIGFDSPPSDWKPWESVQLAVGDLPAFASSLSMDGIQPYTGPAALVGLDILAQRRVILEACLSSSRKRRVFVSS